MIKGYMNGEPAENAWWKRNRHQSVDDSYDYDDEMNNGNNCASSGSSFIEELANDALLYHCLKTDDFDD